MSKKVIALGNKLMMDDGIALIVLEKIQNILKQSGIESIIGETDVDYCFSFLNSIDEFYIIDSTYYGYFPGTVSFMNLEDLKNQTKNTSIHSLALIDLINIYKLDIKGYFIGIEIDRIDINLSISSILEKCLEDICSKILKLILAI